MITVIPADGVVFVLATVAHCKVARFKALGGQYFEVETAANWRELEPDARAAAENQVGALTGDDFLTCPPELAERAAWSE
jgi:hypothetical protein